MTNQVLMFLAVVDIAVIITCAFLIHIRYSNDGKRNMPMFGKFIMISLVSLLFLSCRKDAINLEPVAAPIQIKNFRISASKLVLLQCNAKNTALLLNWDLNSAMVSKDIKYTIESAIDGFNFADSVELGSSDQTEMRFSVKEVNSQISKLINAGTAGVIAIRVRAENTYSKVAAVYSEAIALEVTPYQYHQKYGDSQMIKILPGNYQNWDLLIAPQIVSAGNKGEYEGYINFTNPSSQFLFIQRTGAQENSKVTYYNMGNNKFGLEGSMLSISGGAGVYLLKANTNTNTWGYTKINSWGLQGTAISDFNTKNQDKVMIYDESTLSWSITSNFAAGNFRFRANNANDINFGHNSTEETGVPNYNGDNIPIKKSGNYTIKLQLQSAGNYAYYVKKNS